MIVRTPTAAIAKCRFQIANLKSGSVFQSAICNLKSALMPKQLTRAPRHGLTLLEVLVSLTIFLFSLVAIGQLMFLGKERALEVNLQAKTSMRAQGKLAEIMMGAEQMSATGGYQPFTDDPTLQWRVDISDGGVDNLQLVKVFVKVDLASGKTVESQICQLVLNPSIRGSTMDAPTAIDAGSTDSSGSGSGTTGGSGGTTGGSGGTTGGGGGAGGGSKGGGGGTGGGGGMKGGG
jgi:Prokaryotic N-terminal methylation motif